MAVFGSWVGLAFSVPNLALKRPKGGTLGVKAEFLQSDPGHILDIPGKSPHKSHGGFPQNSRL